MTAGNVGRVQGRTAQSRGVSIGRLLGIEIDLDYSWFLILALMTWALATSYYPPEFRGAPVWEYWLLGLLTAILLFVSVLIHELAHSVVARHFGLTVPRIKLFVFGGVSEIAGEPQSPRVEFWMAIVGPLASVAIGAVFLMLQRAAVGVPPLLALDRYLGLINVSLGVFNLLPGFPLDGGRVFRAIVWQITGDYQRATAVAAGSGRFLGFLFIVVGTWEVIAAHTLGGLWIAFIGWYLESVAGSELQVATFRRLVSNHPVRDAMRRHLPEIAPGTTLQDIVDQYVLGEGASYLVVDGEGDSRGIVTLADVRAVPREKRPTTPAAQVMIPIGALPTVEPDTPLWTALQKQGQAGTKPVIVVDGKHIVGVVAGDDVTRYLGVLQSLGE